MIFGLRSFGVRAILVASALLAQSPLASAAVDPSQARLAIPAGTYEFSKGDASCDGPKVQLQYVGDESDTTLVLGEKYVFAFFNRATFSEDVGDRVKELCTAVTTSEVKEKELISRVVRSCKNKSHSYDETQVLKLADQTLIYSLNRKIVSESKATQLNCEYGLKPAGKP